MKKRYILLLPLLLAGAACSVLKNKYTAKSDSSYNRQATLSRNESLSGTGSTQRLLVLTDSSDHQYAAEIIPSGVFHYSPSEGFTGTASRILIKGAFRNASARRDSSGSNFALTARSDIDSAVQEQAHNARSEKAKEVKHPVNWWLWGVVVAVVMVGGIGYVHALRHRLS